MIDNATTIVRNQMILSKCAHHNIIICFMSRLGNKGNMFDKMRFSNNNLFRRLLIKCRQESSAADSKNFPKTLHICIQWVYTDPGRVY